MHVLFEKRREDGYFFEKEIGIKESDYERIVLEVAESEPSEVQYMFWHASTIEEETAYLDRFNTDLCKYIGIEPSPSLIKRLTYLRMHGDYILKEGVEETLETLSHQFQLGVLTNAMPSRRYHELTINGINKYFSSIIISREIGSFKPDNKIYEVAIENAKVLGDEILFLDDKVKYLDGAKEVGIQHCVLLNINNENTTKYPMINKFSEIINITQNL